MPPRRTQPQTSSGSEDQAAWKKERSDFELRSKESRRSTLRRIQSLSSAVAKHHLNEESFPFVLKSAYEEHVISVAELGKIAHSDPTTASRWINGHTHPNPLVQEAILRKIAELAKQEADELEQHLQKSKGSIQLSGRG
jgi:hypothetical protein